MSEQISATEAEQWFHHPLTRELVDEVKQARQLIVDKWTAGQYTTETAEGTSQKNAQALGNIEMADEVVQWVEDIQHAIRERIDEETSKDA